MALLVALPPLALAVGIVMGALGGGGAILTVPILVYLLGQSPVAATTGSLVIVTTTSVVGIVSHHSAGRVQIRDGLLFGAIGVLGTVPGSLLSRAVPAPALMFTFALVMVAAALSMLHRLRTSSDSDDHHRHRRRLPAVVLTATGVGLLTGFLGVGGGFVVVPALVLVLGFAMPDAVGTSLLVICINSGVALAARIGTGLDVDWPVILIFGSFAAVGTVLGAAVSGRLDPRKLTLAFAVLLFTLAVLVMTSTVIQLRG
ncbi:hypothetical protein KEM60_03298 [Austwickia sp. TVS 96-490-7B]|uniref:sulfite exporter TauE/SafE family protein n=1 Tax=Austwickia sp. TVS 96-490-7B TaxID=2830843 RepID=UPI001C56CB05|nr:sulfite exporter TauE/SafE family protein [Austwickia sp. TVS 96-490-7B]MBW3087068.1 hypothetical protein [Austwickia sp. TVS 96-490-7B]